MHAIEEVTLKAQRNFRSIFLCVIMYIFVFSILSRCTKHIYLDILDIVTFRKKIYTRDIVKTICMRISYSQLTREITIYDTKSFTNWVICICLLL